MSELSASQQARLLALVLWFRGFRSEFDLHSHRGEDMCFSGNVDECLQQYQRRCVERWNFIPDFSLRMMENRGSPSRGYRLEFNIIYYRDRGFRLYQVSAYSTEGKFYEKQLDRNQDLPSMDQLILAVNRSKLKVPLVCRRRRGL
ncbi:hypothetical protein C7475_109216 [Chitinophaga sp. S165]|nr:hypothetical protein C7475_109216 [Chitinophaga sp. S165]